MLTKRPFIHECYVFHVSVYTSILIYLELFRLKIVQKCLYISIRFKRYDTHKQHLFSTFAGAATRNAIRHKQTILGLQLKIYKKFIKLFFLEIIYKRIFIGIFRNFYKIIVQGGMGGIGNLLNIYILQYVITQQQFLQFLLGICTVLPLPKTLKNVYITQLLMYQFILIGVDCIKMLLKSNAHITNVHRRKPYKEFFYRILDGLYKGLLKNIFFFLKELFAEAADGVITYITCIGKGVFYFFKYNIIGILITKLFLFFQLNIFNNNSTHKINKYKYKQFMNEANIVGLLLIKPYVGNLKRNIFLFMLYTTILYQLIIVIICIIFSIGVFICCGVDNVIEPYITELLRYFIEKCEISFTSK